jgi:hypothetical protein
MFPKFKKFDIHVKAVEGVNQQTILGAFITLVSVVVVVVLLISELTLFLKVDVVSRMVADTSAGFESVKLEIDVEFYSVSCEKLYFYQEVTRGTLHVHEPGQMNKSASSGGGCRIIGDIITDKAGGNFRFAVQSGSVVSLNENAVSNYGSNFTHIINHIAFMPTNGRSAVDKIPGLSNILNKQTTVVPEGSGIYQYSIQV